MYFLYLDTTFGLSIGLLDENYSWLDYEDSNESKPSEVIHHKVFLILQKHKLKIVDVQLISVAGPGSYTGMRLSEGFSEVFKWNQGKVFSFYHFEVPEICGVEAGVWATKAFKNQTFCYHWNGVVNSRELIPEISDPEAFNIEKTKKMIYIQSFF
jgi:tRNA threonylcarbamoyladenosine biosynthesis protein TsaB